MRIAFLQGVEDAVAGTRRLFRLALLDRQYSCRHAALEGTAWSAETRGQPLADSDASRRKPRVPRVIQSLIPSLVFLATVCWYLGASSYSYTDFPLDDAWIHQVYARALASGEGFSYNVGQQETGTTSPLWVVVSAPAHWLEAFGPGAVTGAIKGVGVLLGLASVVLLQRITLFLTTSTRAAVIAAACFACEPRLAFSTLSGMENPLLLCMVLAALFSMLRRNWYWASILVGLATVTRPEALTLLPIYALVIGLHRRGAGIAGLASLVVAILPFALWVGLCLSVNGHPLPTTYYVKAHPFQLGGANLYVLWRTFVDQGYGATPISILAGSSLAALVLLGRRPLGSTGGLVMLVFPLLYGVAVAGSRPLYLGGYYWARWVDPASLVATAALCIGLGLMLSLPFDLRVGNRETGSPSGRSVVSSAILIIACAIIAAGAPSFARSLVRSRFHLWSDARAINLVNVQAGLWIKQHVPEHHSVGVNDAGAIRFFGNHRTLDLGGLNFSDVALRRVSIAGAIERCDWLAVFPERFARSEVLREFDQRFVASIPVEQYTVCDCPGQAATVVFERERPADRK